MGSEPATAQAFEEKKNVVYVCINFGCCGLGEHGAGWKWDGKQDRAPKMVGGGDQANSSTVCGPSNNLKGSRAGVSSVCE